jgi:hypothetical protein
VSFNSDPLGDDERGWLGGRQPRTNVRRMWFAVLVLIVILIGLWWLIFRGLFDDDPLTKVPSPSTTVTAPATTAAGGGGQFSAADQRVIEDARRALTAWGEFAVTGDVGKLKDTFWTDGPQYQKLAKEAPALKSKNIGPPPYKFTLTPAQVMDAPGGMKIVRGTVRVTRPEEQTQTFRWDIYMKRVPESNPERWRLWTVAETK